MPDFVGVTPTELRRAGWAVPDLLAREVASLAWFDQLDMAAVLAMYTAEQTFFEMSQGVHIDGRTDYFTATPTQLNLLRHVHRHRWSNAKKGRQAMVTTAYGLGVVLRDCEYLVGQQGVIIADTRETSEMVFGRLIFAYEQQDPSVRVPLARGNRPAARRMKFAHGGEIVVLTMGSKAPAVGRSIDRLHITEFGEAMWQETAAVSMFPTVAKRPYVRVLLEGTPGRAGSFDQVMWNTALEGRGRFVPLFLCWVDEQANEAELWGPIRETFEQVIAEHEDAMRRWWEQQDLGSAAGVSIETLADQGGRGALASLPAEVRRDVFDALLSEEERKYFADLDTANLRNVAFRRDQIDTYFNGDPRLFSSKFPKNEKDGWLGSLRPIMPADALAGMLSAAQPDGAFSLGPSGCLEIHGPVENEPFLVVADPAHYGETGDPSALTVWWIRTNKLTLAAFWQGREDPGKFASRVERAQARYSTRLKLNDPTTIAVESNAMGCIQALMSRGIDGIYWCERTKPGWFATQARILRAESRAVDMLRRGQMEIGARSVLTQLADYDGSQRGKRSTTDDGMRHHFDLARCVLIACDLVQATWFPGTTDDAEVKAPGAPTVATGRPGVTWAEFEAHGKRTGLIPKAPLAPGEAPDDLYRLPTDVWGAS